MKAYLGTTTRELSAISQRVRSNLGITSTAGVVVVEIVGSGPAEKAGLQVADVVVAIDGEPVTSVADLDAKVHGHNAGGRVSIAIEGRAPDRCWRPPGHPLVYVSRSAWRIGVGDTVANRVFDSNLAIGSDSG